MICSCGNNDAVFIRMSKGDKMICDKCSPGLTVGVREYDGNRRIEKQYVPELGCVVSESNKNKVEREMGVKILNKPIDKSYVKEKTERLHSVVPMKKRDEIRKQKIKTLDRRYKRKV